MPTPLNRRTFVKKNLAAGAGLAQSPVFTPTSLSETPKPPQKARIGFIGVGLRGTNHLQNLLYRNDAVVPALCDVDTERITIAQNLLTKAGHKKAEAYTGGDMPT